MPTTAPTAQVTGLASGINWQQTIQLIMQIESQPKVALEDRKQVYENKLTAWQTLNTKLLALKTSMEDLDELDEVLVKAATSSDQDILTASATSAAATGSYSVLVNQLALGDKWTHTAGFADMNTTAVTGTDQVFEYTYGTGGDMKTVTIDVPAGTTLAELASLINNDVDNPGVSATILNQGTGLTPFHLVLSGETGDTNDIAITANTTVPGFGAGSFTETQDAQNAQIRVDGYPGGSWIESATNDVTGVISGVTLHLHSADPLSAATVSITNDNDQVTSKIQSFVDAYNDVISQIDTYTAYDPQSETAGTLFGDASVIGIKSSLQSVIASQVPGLVFDPTVQDPVFGSLSAVGIKSGAGGLLTLDTTKLNDALDEDFNAVGAVFAFSASSTNDNLTYFTRTDNTQGGTYNVVANYDGSGNLTSATINGNAAQVVGNLVNGYYIVGADGKPEEGLRIKFTYPGGAAGNISADVRVGTGTAVQIGNKISFLTDPTDGTVKYAEDGIQETIDSIDKQIENWDARLQAKQDQLTREFLAMETMISRLQGQGNYAASMIAQL